MLGVEALTRHQRHPDRHAWACADTESYMLPPSGQQHVWEGVSLEAASEHHDMYWILHGDTIHRRPIHVAAPRAATCNAPYRLRPIHVDQDAAVAVPLAIVSLGGQHLEFARGAIRIRRLCLEVLVWQRQRTRFGGALDMDVFGKSAAKSITGSAKPKRFLCAKLLADEHRV